MSFFSDEVEEYKKQSTVREPSPLGGDSAVESGVNSAENSVDNGGELCNDRQDPLEIDEGISNRIHNEIEPRTRTLSMQGLSSSDPNIYHTFDSSAVSDNDSMQGQGSFSQSSRSTSTSAGYSLNSNPNSQEVSPIDSCGDPENSATIQDARGDFHVVSDCGDSVQNMYSVSDSGPRSSPTEAADVEFKQRTVINDSEDWDAECSSSGDKTVQNSTSYNEIDEDLRRYFHADRCESPDTGQRSKFRPGGFKTFCMLNSSEHKFILLINVKMPTIVGILTFISRINTSERFKARNFFICQYFSFMSS